MKTFPKVLSLIIIGFVSFSFFFYFSFPYEVLKETIASKASEATGYNIEIGKMSPSLPLGLSIENLGISTRANQEVRIAKMNVNISVLRFFIGKLGVNLSLQDEKSGTLDLFLSFGILGLIGGSVNPGRIVLEAETYKVDDFFNFLLKNKGQSEDTNVLLKPLFEAFKIEGKLNAHVDLSLDNSDPANSVGLGEISFTDLALVVTDRNMSIPNQAFDKAKIKADLKNGQLKLDPTSGLASKDLSLMFSGQLIQKADITFDLTVAIQLQEVLKNQFGWALDAAANKQADGQISLHIGGSVSEGPDMTVL